MRGIKIRKDLPFSVPEIEDITDKLPRKSSWEDIKKKWTVKGVWDGKTYHTGLRKTEEITSITIHHSASPEGSIESHAKHHANKWGAGVSYHIIIDNGRIYQTNNLLSFTYHNGNNNTYTIGICVNRDLTKSPLTSQERELLYAAILTVKKLFPSIKEIKGHNEYPTAATACPGTSVNVIRQDIFNIEMEIDRNNSPDKQLEIAGRMANHLLYLHRLAVKGIDAYGKPVTEGNRDWALKQLLLLEEPFRQWGWLK